MWSNYETPYNELPDPPSRDMLETPAVLRKVVSARSGLAELKGLCRALPRPDLLLNSIVIQESRDSSAIENIVTTQDQIYQAILSPFDSAPPVVKEVLRYREALETGLTTMEQRGGLSANVALFVMQRIKATTAGLRSIPGVKLTNPLTKRIIYTPPDPVHLNDMLARWEKFVNQDDGMDPLVRMAAMHYQFEAIHPFSDGNGRTGRILNVLFLVNAGLLAQPILYLSSHILDNRDAYYRSLREVTELDEWESWVLYMLDAVEQTSYRTITLIQEILNLKREVTEELRGISQKMPVGDLAELLFSFPYIKIGTLIEKGLGSRPTATAYLKAMAERGTVERMKIGREIYFVNHRLMDLLSQRQKV